MTVRSNDFDEGVVLAIILRSVGPGRALPLERRIRQLQRAFERVSRRYRFIDE